MISPVFRVAAAQKVTLPPLYDVAVRDVVMSIAALTLARLAEVRQPRAASVFNTVSDRHSGRVTA